VDTGPITATGAITVPGVARGSLPICINGIVYQIPLF
jgi:hypothetical protein